VSENRAPEQAGVEPGKRRMPRFVWLLVSVAIVGIIVLIQLFPPGQPPSGNSGTPRAVIIDQLSVLLENPAFIAEVTGQLEEYGFEVDLYQGDDVTVDLYRELPARNYRVIIFRAHSGIMAQGDRAHIETVIFTNEEYNRLRHYPDQIASRLRMATADIYQPVLFGIPPKFITEAMTGRFDDTVVIMMGCSGSYLDDLAMAFIGIGALAYLGWDDIVGLHYVDRATAYLVRQLCSEGLTIEEAVASTMAHIGPDPQYKAKLRYYPPASGDNTLARLTG